MKKAIVLGAGGFIGHHLVKRLKQEGFWVKGIDIKLPEFSDSLADEFIVGDLRDYHFTLQQIDQDIDELYQLAGDVGGAGYIFTGLNDANVMHNSAQINLNVAKVALEQKVKAVFFSSSACVYPEYNQMDPNNPKCDEPSAYPAEPDSEYGWEKLFSERLYLSYHRNFGLNVKIARFHNIFGPESTWNNVKEKAPSALCRKVAEADKDGTIEIWGDGQQTRSFLYIDDCLDGVTKLMRSNKTGPYNIGSEEMISIQDFAKLIAEIANKPEIRLKMITGPTGVRGRSSDNALIKNDINWDSNQTLKEGIKKLYLWIEDQVNSTSK